MSNTYHAYQSNTGQLQQLSTQAECSDVGTVSSIQEVGDNTIKVVWTDQELRPLCKFNLGTA